MDEHDAPIETIRDLAFEISQGDDSDTPEENWVRAERVIRRGDANSRAALAIERDDSWSELDDEEHAALQAVHTGSALA